VHTHPRRHRRAARELERQRVEQRVVVVRLDVVDGLARVAGVARGSAVVVDLRSLDRVAGAVDEAVVAQVAGQPDLVEVLTVQQPRALRTRRAVRGRTVGIGVQAAREPWMRGSSSNGPPPRTPSRRRSLNVPIPVPAILSWLACTKRALFATSPKFQPSP
jgi:hypothetical protein